MIFVTFNLVVKRNHMKKKLFILSSLILIAFTSCKKNDNKTNSTQDVVKDKKVEISYRDTITSPLKNLKTDSSKRTNGLFDTPPVPRVALIYNSNGNYSIIAYNNQNGNNINCTYTMYKNGSQIGIPGYAQLSITSSGQAISFSATLSPANYAVRVYYNEGPFVGSSFDLTFTIYSTPVVPTGKLALFRYVNPRKGQHFLTTNWEELASGSNDFIYERVQGYVYPNSSSAPNLQGIYRYYNSSKGDHLYQNSYTSPPSGFVYEGVIGYLGTTATGDLNLVLNRYYNSGAYDHFYCSPPENPTPYGYSLEGIFGYIQTP